MLLFPDVFIFDYWALIFTCKLIMPNFMLINILHPPLFEEKKGNEGVS